MPNQTNDPNVPGDSRRDESEIKPPLELEIRPERRLIRPGGSRRHIVYRIRVPELPHDQRPERAPLNLALVIDRSGSMHGDKLKAAKLATRVVLETLGERDRVALLAYDDRMETIQTAAPVTAELRQRTIAALDKIQARGSTALHEGWLAGCQLIASDRPQPTPGDGYLSRCFLLTDGLANIGETDPERIASDAARIRQNTGIVTSTFGIGADYDENLLAPMAAAGSGQFHNLRTPAEIARTFAGELGEALLVAAGGVTLDLRLPPGVTPHIISDYWQDTGDEGGQFALAIGDLLPGEERYIVVRFQFPTGDTGANSHLEARLRWQAEGDAVSTDWMVADFEYASDSACNAERRDAAAMHWVGLHTALRAERQASHQSGQGDMEDARRTLDRAIRRISEYAGADPELRQALASLAALKEELSHRRLSAMETKEAYFKSYTSSRMLRDKR